MRDWLQAMSQIHRYFNRVVSLSRDEMCEPFRDLLGDWCRGLPRGAVALVVTLGYSKTVRELIRLGRTDDDGTGAGTLVGIRPRFFQLLGGDGDEMDARMMAWELRRLRQREADEPAAADEPATEDGLAAQDAAAAKEKRAAEDERAAGSGQMLASLLRPRDRVLVLLGAEAVDIDGRVVHPRSILEQLSALLERLRACDVPTLVVVAAESYKHLDQPFLTSPFYRGQFERIGVYGRAMVDLVLSDVGLRPAHWPWVVLDRLHRTNVRARSLQPTR